jgi:hypothetical protein
MARTHKKGDAMRITDCRYDRDRLRLTVAYRLIIHGARTQTIRIATGLSGDRVRKLFRYYHPVLPGACQHRKRGKSPRQMSFFRRTLDHEMQSATLACLLACCGLTGRAPRLPGPPIEEVARFCDVYETFLCVCPESPITIEHAWYLAQVLAHRDEYVLENCPDCRGAWIRDTLDVLPYNCAACRAGRPPGPTVEDC